MTADLQVDRNVADLRSYIQDLRSLVGAIVAREPTMLSEALRTIAEHAETTLQRLEALDREDPDPSAFDEDDLTILILLAGYSSGREGITAATEVIRRVTDIVSTETVGDTRE